MPVELDPNVGPVGVVFNCLAIVMLYLPPDRYSQGICQSSAVGIRGRPVQNLWLVHNHRLSMISTM